MAPVTAEPTPVIFDTDLDSDVDDVQALALLHGLMNAKEIELLGVVVTSKERYAASAADAINTFFGRPELPIGYLRHPDSLRTFSKYTRSLSQEFANDIRDTTGTEEAVSLYRRLLSASEDSSVIIVTVGHLSSLAALLASGPDNHSPLTGHALAHRKVKRWICMGGTYPQGKEANFYRPDPAATVYCIRRWHNPVVFAGWEVGQRIETGGSWLRSRLPANNPVYRAYELYNGFAGRPAWDQVAVMLLARDRFPYFDFVRGGSVILNDAGENQWVDQARENTRHAYVRIKPGLDPARIARHIDRFTAETAHP